MIHVHDARLRLCAITDDLRDGIDGLLTRALAAQQGGATMVQLRLKHADAQTLVEVGRALVGALSVPVIVSERLDVALACGAAGVHLTARSMTVQAIRPLVSADFLIGGSVNVAADLLSAASADYVTIGPVFDGTSETMGLDGFAKLATACDKPAIAIGGIFPASAPALRSAGASGIAVIRSIFAADDPRAAAVALSDAFMGNAARSESE
jgi:thiamine-phosphate pyrophosphorylase